MIQAVELRLVRLPLVRPFRTSLGTDTTKEAILVRVVSDGPDGWGECVAGPDPSYSEEFNAEAWVTLRDHLVPAALSGVDAAVRGHRMAKAAMEMALTDHHLKVKGISLAEQLGTTRTEVPVGVSIGIPVGGVPELLDQVDAYLGEGYRRIKLKIEPGFDVEPVGAVRHRHPDILLSVDANAAYSSGDTEPIEALEGFGLLMIEQPLSHEDLWEHARLQERLETPLCLDESIRSAADAAAALDMGACRIINIKQGRVGGLTEAIRIHDLCFERGVPVWCGGMLEMGVGRAANLALAALPGFTLPGDISASARYFQEDLTEPFVLQHDGMMRVPSGPGLGADPRPDRLEATTVESLVIRP
jgi:O-succinylbenzoate synthase